MAEVNEPSTATVERADDGAGLPVIRLGGELDISNIPTVEAELQPLLATVNTGAVFDLSALHQQAAELTLNLADGRLLDFCVANDQGTIRSTGRGLYRV